MAQFDSEPRVKGFVFAHERLEVYGAAREFAEMAQRLAARIPRGHRWLADQLLRSGGAPMLLIAEGANRRGRGEKHQRFSEASGECGEAVAAAEQALGWSLISSTDFFAFRDVAARIASMLMGLMRRWDG